MNKVIFTSYYTINTPYEQVIQDCLLPTLKKWDIKHDIEAIPDRGNWALNTGYKSTHLLKMLEKHKCDIVFIDADAKIIKYPTVLFEVPNEYDISIHKLNWFLQWRNKPGDRFELLSGTMLLKYKPKVIELVKRFISEIKKDPVTWEQRTMERIVNETPDLKIFSLPKEYITIPRQDGSCPKHINKEDVVIWHTQASRRFRK